MKKTIVLIFLVTVPAITICQGFNNSNEILADSITKNSKYYGLIIGVNNCIDHSFPDMDKPINFAEKLYSILISSYNFKVENTKLLKDGTKAELSMSLNELSKVVTSEDMLLIFYAGHGLWDVEERRGYWIPFDARKSSKENWFSDSLLFDYLRRINSKSTLLIVDASYSGSLFKVRSAYNVEKSLFELYNLPSRKAMTSCTLTEADDNGIFMRYLLEKLYRNGELLVSSEQLFSSLRIAVMNNTNSIPQYGTISGTGDKGGDFVFLKSD